VGRFDLRQKRAAPPLWVRLSRPFRSSCTPASPSPADIRDDNQLVAFRPMLSTSESLSLFWKKIADGRVAFVTPSPDGGGIRTPCFHGRWAGNTLLRSRSLTRRVRHAQSRWGWYQDPMFPRSLGRQHTVTVAIAHARPDSARSGSGWREVVSRASDDSAALK
jgi:hypothetical protein